MLSRDAILKVQDLKREEVQIPEWGGSVFVRTMTGAEKDRFEQSNYREPDVGEDGLQFDWEGYRARLVAAVVCDAEGAPLFSGAKPFDIAALGGKSAVALDRILDVAKRLNAISQADIEALAKN